MSSIVFWKGASWRIRSENNRSLEFVDRAGRVFSFFFSFCSSLFLSSPTSSGMSARVGRLPWVCTNARDHDRSESLSAAAILFLFFFQEIFYDGIESVFFFKPRSETLGDSLFTSAFFSLFALRFLCSPLMGHAPAAAATRSPIRTRPSTEANRLSSHAMAASNGPGNNNSSNNPLPSTPPPIRTSSALLSPSALARVRMASIQQQQSSTPPSATFATDDIRITAPNVEFAPPSLRKDCVLFYYPVRDDEHFR